jgi:hypothetical protein
MDYDADAADPGCAKTFTEIGHLTESGKSLARLQHHRIAMTNLSGTFSFSPSTHRKEKFVHNEPPNRARLSRL